MASSVRRTTSVLAIAALGCGGSSAEAPVGVSAQGATTARFVFDSLDDRPVTSEALAGKPAVLAFVTTWDLASQAELGFLGAMAKRDEGRVRYAGVVLGERSEREVAERYRDALAAPFPIARADLATASSAGFGEVRAVPCVIVLDARGRIVLRRDGLSKPEDLRPAINLALAAK